MNQLPAISWLAPGVILTAILIRMVAVTLRWRNAPPGNANELLLTKMLKEIQDHPHFHLLEIYIKSPSEIYICNTKNGANSVSSDTPISRYINHVSNGEQDGPIFSLKLGSQSVVVLTSGELIKSVVDKRSSNYADRPRLYMQDIWEGSRIIMRGYDSLWKVERKLYHQFLNINKAARYVPYQDLETKQLLVDLLSNPKDFEDLITRTTLSAATSMAYGFRVLDPKSEVMQELFKNTHGFFVMVNSSKLLGKSTSPTSAAYFHQWSIRFTWYFRRMAELLTWPRIMLLLKFQKITPLEILNESTHAICRSFQQFVLHNNLTCIQIGTLNYVPLLKPCQHGYIQWRDERRKFSIVKGHNSTVCMTMQNALHRPMILFPVSHPGVGLLPPLMRSFRLLSRYK